MALLDASELFDIVNTDGESEDTRNILERFRSSDIDIPIEMTDLEVWSNYTNEDLYYMDKKIREFFKKTRYKRKANNGYRTTASAIFTWVYGRPPTPADGSATKVIHVLLKYYCTNHTRGASTYCGKKVTRVYAFSPYSCLKKRPYSLRLRLEEMENKNAVFRKGPRKDKQVVGRLPNSSYGTPKTV